MLPTNFKIAMFNHVGSGPFEETTDAILSPGREWLIVERHGKTLSISQGNISSECRDTDATAHAPFSLRANATLIGYHIHSNAEGSEAQFLLSSLSPENNAPEDAFVPACGVVTLRFVGGKVSLTAEGHDYYHDRSQVQRGCAPVLGDPRVVFSLGDRTKLSRRWSFAAQHRPWVAERMPALTSTM